MTHTAELVWITPDAEKLVGKIARVSNPENEDNPDYEKLLKVSNQTQALVTI